ncbi:NADH-quinone oxidoreductase subunit J [Pokkaliibacter sp. CJK22405]|uniref:NADH-quinone oxidoreductase subunit J family protein n=1 Tax=Pokkaliibacter sp. CJK22405 TaxID=3384615 RepID=UPI003985424E
MLLWQIVFWLALAVAVICAGSLLFVRKPMHGAVYLTSSMVALALVFYLLGAPFIAMMQLILYVGAIMVLFVFVIMLSPVQETFPFDGADKSLWPGLILLAVLLVELALVLFGGVDVNMVDPHMVNSKEVGELLFGHYKLAVEAVSTLLLAALVGVLYFARHLQHDQQAQVENAHANALKKPVSQGGQA